MDKTDAAAISACVCLAGTLYKWVGVASVQEGMVIRDARGSHDCRVGLVLPQEQAEALRCACSILYNLVPPCFAVPVFIDTSASWSIEVRLHLALQSLWILPQEQVQALRCACSMLCGRCDHLLLQGNILHCSWRLLMHIMVCTVCNASTVPSQYKDTLFQANLDVRTKHLGENYCILTAIVLLSKDNLM